MYYVLMFYLEPKGVYLFLKAKQNKIKEYKPKDLEVFILVLSTVCYDKGAVNVIFLSKTKSH